VAELAEANTSTGAPSVICSLSPELGPKLNMISTPGWISLNASATPAKASVKDAEAETRRSPDRPGPPMVVVPSRALEHAAISSAIATIRARPRLITPHVYRLGLLTRRLRW